MDYYKIINKNVIKIFNVFTNEKLYFNQIHELTGIKSKNNLLKNLNHLINLNLLKKEKNKSNTFYRINYENFVAITILQLININKLYSLPFEKRKSIEEFINNVKPLIAIVFGSTAKGNFKINSDIDLLLIFQEKEEIREKIREISSKYGTNINSIVLTLKKFEKSNEAIKHIIKTGYTISGYNYFYGEYKKI